MPTTEERNDRNNISPSPQKLLDVSKIVATLLKHKLLWIVPTILFTALGLLHVLTKSDKWEAYQPLIVRDEAISEMGFSNSNTPLGRFESNDSLKRFLETVLQVAKNREVAKSALVQVGPPKKKKRKGFPTKEDIEDMISATKVSSPKGTEFGTSEMIYLSVTSTDPNRAIALNTALADELENRLRGIRRSYTDSIISELEQKRDLADESLDKATEQLSALEFQLGEDLGEMRTLAEPGSGGSSNLREWLTQIRTELREAESQQTTLNELKLMLTQFRGDADAILAAPNRLFESQPALRRLKDGLVDAQLRSARLRGGLMETHPRIKASLQNEQSIEAQLFSEVDNAVTSVGAEMFLNEKRVASLKTKLDDVTTRLNKLAKMRAPYLNMASEVNQQREQLLVANASLAKAVGRQEASMTSSLITRIDQPVTGSRPQGPGKKVLLLGSSLAGLGLGLSLVYLLAPWQERIGRRQSDKNSGRRRTDHVVPTAALTLQPSAETVSPEPVIVASSNPSAPISGYVPNDPPLPSS